MDDLYPVTIVMARYQGTYEGGKWLAFYCYPEIVPHAAFADDVTCACWWASGVAKWVGRGWSPDGALADLNDRLRRHPPHKDKPFMGIRYDDADDLREER